MDTPCGLAWTAVSLLGIMVRKLEAAGLVKEEDIPVNDVSPIELGRWRDDIDANGGVFDSLHPCARATTPEPHERHDARAPRAPRRPSAREAVFEPRARPPTCGRAGMRYITHAELGQVITYNREQEGMGEREFTFKCPVCRTSVLFARKLQVRGRRHVVRIPRDPSLAALHALRLADPGLGVKLLVAKLKEQQPGLEIGAKEVREMCRKLEELTRADRDGEQCDRKARAAAW